MKKLVYKILNVSLVFLLIMLFFNINKVNAILTDEMKTQFNYNIKEVETGHINIELAKEILSYIYAIDNGKEDNKTLAKAIQEEGIDLNRLNNCLSKIAEKSDEWEDAGEGIGKSEIDDIQDKLKELDNNKPNNPDDKDQDFNTDFNDQAKVSPELIQFNNEINRLNNRWETVKDLESARDDRNEFRNDLKTLKSKVEAFVPKLEEDASYIAGLKTRIESLERRMGSVQSTEVTKVPVISSINPMDYRPSDLTTENAGGLTTIGGKILGMVNTVGVVISVIVLTLIGIKYMIGSVDEKAQYKQTMVPYVIGAVLLMSGTTVVNVLYQLGKNIW